MYSAREISASGANTGLSLDSLAYAGLCAFVVAFSSGLDGRVVGSLVLANAVALIPVGLLGLRILVDKQIRRLRDLHFLLITFVAWSAASYLWTVSPDHTSARVGTYVALLVFLVLIWELANSTARVRGLIISYTFGASAAS